MVREPPRRKALATAELPSLSDYFLLDHSQQKRRLGQYMRDRYGEVDIARGSIVNGKAEPQHEYQRQTNNQGSCDQPRKAAGMTKYWDCLDIPNRTTGTNQRQGH